VTSPRQSICRVGREARPIIVIDDFAADPDALRAAALGAAFGPGGHHYPGVRAALPEHYLVDQVGIISAALAELSGSSGRLDMIDASYSIVTTPPAALSIPQRIPHCDAFDPARIALVHYLSDDPDGTAFYRHRATGFETIDEARRPIYFDQLEAELRHGGPPPAAYVNGDTPLFEQLLALPARYNRALVYPSYLLHSGMIAPNAGLSADPATGRLTVTGFLSFHPRGE
jgi:hypothetical protein